MNYRCFSRLEILNSGSFLSKNLRSKSLHLILEHDGIQKFLSRCNVNKIENFCLFIIVESLSNHLGEDCVSNFCKNPVLIHIMTGRTNIYTVQCSTFQQPFQCFLMLFIRTSNQLRVIVSCR